MENKMVRVDFDLPTYLRAKNGLAIVSARLNHLLPDDEPEMAIQTQAQPLNPVVINRVFNQNRLIKQDKQEEIRGEFIPLEESEDAAVEPDKPESTELSFAGKVGKSVTGLYGGSGYAHYRFIKKNGKSFYLRIGSHIVWGIELAAAIRRSGAKEGDKISLTFKGKTPVKILKDVKQADGSIEQDWLDTHRNAWEITVC
jgi:hypothetical protein